jgi:hypothetical protein
VLFQEFLGQRGDDLRVGDLRADPRVRHAVGLREGLGDLVFGADAQLDEDFAEQLLVVRALLLLERALELLLLDQAASQQELTERFSLDGGDHCYI